MIYIKLYENFDGNLFIYDLNAQVEILGDFDPNFRLISDDPDAGQVLKPPGSFRSSGTYI